MEGREREGTSGLLSEAGFENAFLGAQGRQDRVGFRISGRLRKVSCASDVSTVELGERRRLAVMQCEWVLRSCGAEPHRRITLAHRSRHRRAGSPTDPIHDESRDGMVFSVQTPQPRTQLMALEFGRAITRHSSLLCSSSRSRRVLCLNWLPLTSVARSAARWTLRAARGHCGNRRHAAYVLPASVLCHSTVMTILCTSVRPSG